MNHGHRFSRGSGDHVNLRVDPGQRPLQHDHGKHAGTCRHVAGPYRHSIGGGHAGAGVALRRRQGNAAFQRAAGVQQSGALRCQAAGIHAGGKHLGQNIPQFPGIALVRYQSIEGVHHGLVVVAASAVDGEHAAGLPHAQHFTAGELIVDIPGQRSEIVDVSDMLLPVEDRLIQMGNGPAQWDVELEPLGQRGSRGAGGGVAPGAERCQQFSGGVEGNIAVHHGRKAHGAHPAELFPAGILHAPDQLAVSALQSRPYVLHVVRPVATLIAVFPVVLAGGQGDMIRADQHCLDAGGAQLDAKIGLAGADRFSHIHFHASLTCSFP